MIHLRLNVKDSGNSWSVIGPNVNEEILVGSDIYECTSWEVYEYICANLNEGYAVYIPKNIESQLTIDDITVLFNDNELDKYRVGTVNSIKDFMFTNRLCKLAVIDYFAFAMLNNYFNAMGYPITNENREEQYLAIVTKISEMEDQKESDEIISKLEHYLNLIDKLSEYEGYLEKMYEAIEQVNNAETKEEIEKVLEDLREFFK